MTAFGIVRLKCIQCGLDAKLGLLEKEENGEVVERSMHWECPIH